MARQLRFLSAGRTSPDERRLPVAERRGPQLVLRVVSDDLKGQPVHEIELIPAQALETIRALAVGLLAAER